MSEENVNQEVQAQSQATITLGDMVALYQVINIASKRGAFEANELTAVGNLADKLKTFVDKANEQAQAAAAESEAEAE
jgi:hypothetical protein